jgi:hypothetical protein
MARIGSDRTFAYASFSNKHSFTKAESYKVENYKGVSREAKTNAQIMISGTNSK